MRFNDAGSLVLPVFAGIVAATIIVPLPWQLLDLLIAANISLSLVLLLLVSTARAAEVTVFPTAILLATLFRTALNVASTRLVLSQGYAGQVIQRFGEFVAAGNPILGLVMFVIITVVQFVVVTRGAERVAEVAARFTLDAMPGKQMSVDADLNAGLITEEEAKKRRQEIRREADFYGAMDGASRFTRGDAVAGLVIVGVNLLGGFAVGVLQQQLSPAEAFTRYALLTIGDGLASQIPALLTAAATGVAVTRAAEEDDLGRSMVAQIAGQPRAVLGTGLLICCLGLAPGMAHLPLLGVGALLVAAGLAARRRTPETPRVPELQAPAFEDIYRTMVPDKLVVELGAAAAALANPDSPDGLPARIGGLRRHLARQMGVVLPPVRLRESAELKATGYAILLRGVEVARGEVLPGHLLAVAAGETGEIPGVPARDPAFGLPALWIEEARRHEAEVAGWTVVDLASVIITHLTEVVRRHADELLDREEVQRMLEAVRREHPALVDDLIPGTLSVAEVQEVLRGLVREGVPLTDLPGILDALGRAARTTKDCKALTAAVRRALARLITKSAGLDRGAPVLVLDPAVEQRLVEDALRTPGALDPNLAEKLVCALADRINAVTASSRQMPVVVCAGEIRETLRALVEKISPRVAVLAYHEVAVDVKPTAVVRLQDA